MVLYTLELGTGGDLKSATLPLALLELAVRLNLAENERNTAYQALAPQQRVTIDAALGEGVTNITINLPYTTTVSANQTEKKISDYLGGAFADFAPGTGATLKSLHLMGAIAEVASLLSIAENSVPAPDTPNFCQVVYSDETNLCTITANLPSTVEIDASGTVRVQAINYLPNA